MEGDNKYDSVYSTKVRAGKRRTYFFDVRQTKGEDFFVTITESTKKFNSPSFERHKIFLYKEDFNRFMEGLNDAVNHVKTDLLPDYDYEEFEKKQQEWEANKLLEEQQDQITTNESTSENTQSNTEPGEDDISW